MRLTRLAKPLAVTGLALSTIINATGWYLAAHSRGNHHFDSCSVDVDGTLVLRYTYGAGDKVTTLVAPNDQAIVVSLHLDTAPGPHPAIALHGETRVDTFGGLRNRQVKDADGTILACAGDL
ncbi:hypothetical protein [Nocardioides mesophilus]|uniref:Uncharacterized protein n=1 Tax=Nocardioides mesophilus TaxID=433659 RepID=A0A7G9RGI4_9ACTN|nr:hypothetical protein [Nocardioides mesophilus]QNN54709.1 hypothetical protein H9L09_10655 [Nocardioides mesophilus]